MRFHVHLNTPDLAAQIQFYAQLFGRQPDRLESDYAKWILDDPALNFAISTAKEANISHLGVQVEKQDALLDWRQRANTATESRLDQDNASCCYALSDKTWVADEDGTRWEFFHTHGQLAEYGQDVAAEPRATARPADCCQVGQ